MAEIELVLGANVVESYKRLSYTPWHALAEFVDNSTQSYFNNRELLDRHYSSSGEKLTVDIVYDRQSGSIRIVDNAMGMSRDELQRALRVGYPPENVTGRSQYGMGMKTAAGWLGNNWTITTSKLGDSLEHIVNVNVERVARGDLKLPYESRESGPSRGYTIIDIHELNREFHGRTISKIRDYIRSMYRQDFRDGVLKLTWNSEPLTWQELDSTLLRSANGSLYKREFIFTVHGKRVRGWVGVLGRGSRAQAGFSILHRNRVVRGWPDAWRPESLYGQIQGSNDLVNQRLVGEIHLDDFDVSHTKDDILWVNDEEDLVQQRLREECVDYYNIAKTYRRDEHEQKPSELETQAAVDELKKELESPEIVDRLTLNPIPIVQAAKDIEKGVIEEVRRNTETFSAVIDSMVNIKGYLQEFSVSDPYVVYELSNDSVRHNSDHAMDEILVIININHPHWAQLKGAEGVLNYLRHCIYDAVAEWHAGRLTAPVNQSTIKVLKDQLLRLPFDIERHDS